VTLESIFRIVGPDSHVTHPDMRVEIEVRTFNATALLKCSCGARADVEDDALASMEQSDG
jgi:hypothetical protein